MGYNHYLSRAPARDLLVTSWHRVSRLIESMVANETELLSGVVSKGVLVKGPAH